MQVLFYLGLLLCAYCLFGDSSTISTQVSFSPFGYESRIPTVKFPSCRSLKFWAQALGIYSSYKSNECIYYCGDQICRGLSHCGLRCSMPPDFWDKVHEVNSQRLLNLLLSLKGFYLKTGQFLASRNDIVPEVYIEKLRSLHENVPFMNGNKVREILEGELNGPLEDYFTDIDLTAPIGSASIAQVHKATWKSNRKVVAVKVQHEYAEGLMNEDLNNIRVFAGIIQKFEGKFNFVSSVEEIQRQIAAEFDFCRESQCLTEFGDRFAKSSFHRKVIIPKPFFATKRCLIMSHIDGKSLSKLMSSKEKTAKKSLDYSFTLLECLLDIWGYQIFEMKKFHGDPHPGNLCISTSQKLGIFDWGQVKVLSPELVADLARVYRALAVNQTKEIALSVHKLGVVFSNNSDVQSIARMAHVLFDIRALPELTTTPTPTPTATPTSMIPNAIVSIPSEIFYFVRCILIFRGMLSTLQSKASPGFSLTRAGWKELSLVTIWKHYYS